MTTLPNSVPWFSDGTITIRVGGQRYRLTVSVFEPVKKSVRIVVTVPVALHASCQLVQQETKLNSELVFKPLVDGDPSNTYVNAYVSGTPVPAKVEVHIGS